MGESGGARAESDGGSQAETGPNHPHTLTSMNNLAFTWESLGRQSEALDLMRKCVSIRRGVLGAHHPHYLSSLDALNSWEQKHADANTSA